MMEDITGGPAFPAGLRQHQGSYDKTTDAKHPGMSLRDYFAGQVMAGFCVEDDAPLQQLDGESVMDARRRYWIETAGIAYIAADAMLIARQDAPLYAKPTEGGAEDAS